MTLLSVEQKLTASNIANIDTPGYRTRGINFQNELARVTEGEAPEVQEVPGLYSKNDGNNVSLDRETRMLSENAMRFSVAANLVHSQLATLRSAITEGTNQ
jgi:flagellar basal-body rod protein FlgB